MTSFSSEFIWLQFSVDYPSELEESLIWKFDELGLKRFAFQYSTIKGSKPKLLVWLPKHEWSISERNIFVESLEALGKPFSLELENSDWAEFGEEDWSESWKRHWQPDPVGERLLILPAWLSIPSRYSNRRVLLMDPGSAFGTGSHPTTRLCLEALEQEPLAEKVIADLGCGSGVLGLAAVIYGAKKVFATDIDSLAVRATMENSKINGCQDLMKVELGSIEVLLEMLNGRRVDYLLCNILAPVIKSLAPKFEEVLSEKGIAFLSGLLVEQAPELQSVLQELGWRASCVKKQGSWALLHVSKRA